MKQCEPVFSISALALYIAERLDDDQLSILSADLVQLADTLASILARRTICEKNKEKAITKKSDLSEMK